MAECIEKSLLFEGADESWRAIYDGEWLAGVRVQGVSRFHACQPTCPEGLKTVVKGFTKLTRLPTSAETEAL